METTLLYKEFHLALDAINDDGSSGQAVFCMVQCHQDVQIQLLRTTMQLATTDDGSCEYINGCMDLAACNFDSGQLQMMVHVNTYFSCVCDGTVVTVDGGSFQGEVSWTIADCDGIKYRC